ncbi:copper homeostasis protein CutC [Bizionia myxarmorum]|uniref:PF03932 family protein CutC n=1 Tax=Bizionia myxarmorum TaxID=291186 RepID=A0A5D0RC00_9FLAO|nr:copper homeostasis protein CutC [Bizionia myxarmorum]TYB78426.1 copper homeostasis protein CutC [Bizionia myxarmorum]
MRLEICANSYQSAINAEKAGAHRIELCSELAVGGITPSYGLIKQVIEHLSIPVFVLIRPRSGNFTYTQAQFEIIKHDIEICKNLGVAGIVSGVLNADNTIDLKRTQELIALANPLPFTFHRAFDCVSNPFEAFQQLINLGVKRILTSGLESSAEKGLDLLIKLQEKAGDSLTILAGSGINPKNASKFKAAGLKEIHASASKVVSIKNNHVYFGNTPQTVSCEETIKQILNQIQK